MDHLWTHRRFRVGFGAEEKTTKILVGLDPVPRVFGNPEFFTTKRYVIKTENDVSVTLLRFLPNLFRPSFSYRHLTVSSHTCSPVSS